MLIGDQGRSKHGREAAAQDADDARTGNLPDLCTGAPGPQLGSDRIGGMQITETRGPDGQVETILVGRLPDQAALSGILKSLYDLHFPVVMAECVTSEDCSN